MDETALSNLLSPISEEAPSGPNLEYDPDFIELDTVSKGKAESQFGDTVIPAEEPDWPVVSEKAQNMLRRSKDLRVAVLLLRANTHTRGLAGFVSGLKLLKGLTEQFWPSIHPQLDADDGDDATMRMNALAALADSSNLARPNVVLKDLRDASLSSSRMTGPLTVRHVEIAWDKLSPREGETVKGRTEVTEALADLKNKNDANFDALASALTELKALQKLLEDKVTASQAPVLTSLQASLHTLSQIHAELTLSGLVEGGSAENVAALEPGSAAALLAAGAGSGGTLKTREDARRMLDQISQFLQKMEPGNPAPLLIERAKRLIGANFLEIIEDLAPDALRPVKHITGTKDSG